VAYPAGAGREEDVTQAILLGAGRSSRMDAERGDGPKWMLEVQGLSLAQHLVNALHQCDVTEVTLARGPLGGAVQTPSVAYRDVLASRNMLETLYAVRDAVHGDVLVLYCDLIVEPRLIASLIEAPGEAAVVVDRRWRSLFSLRADDPLSIAESCSVDNGLIRDIGQPLRPEQVPDAQYVGMMRFSGRMFGELVRLYEQLSHHYAGKVWRNAKSFETAFMTDF
jgi:choline kinase